MARARPRGLDNIQLSSSKQAAEKTPERVCVSMTQNTIVTVIYNNYRCDISSFWPYSVHWKQGTRSSPHSREGWAHLIYYTGLKARRQGPLGFCQSWTLAIKSNPLNIDQGNRNPTGVEDKSRVPALPPGPLQLQRSSPSRRWSLNGLGCPGAAGPALI